MKSPTELKANRSGRSGLQSGTAERRRSDQARSPVIAVDAMGGDHAPQALVEGACSASLSSDVVIELVGDPRQIQAHLDRTRHVAERIRVVPALESIPMDASPRDALALLPDASLPLAAKRVATPGGPDALVTAGNTGAVVLACALAFRRLSGVRRTALAAVIPTPSGREGSFSLLLDAGATLRVEAQDLAAFALMGATYSRIVGGQRRPRVALLSNGSEPSKGPPEIVAAHPLLRRLPGIEFIGNIESLDLPRGVADVIVCDGFTGNVTLKMLEGFSAAVTDLAGYAYRSRFTWRVALWLLGGGIRRLKAITDWEQYGGAPILGFDRPCIKAHGRSGPRAIHNAIRVAESCIAEGLCERIESGVQENSPISVAEDELSAVPSMTFEVLG